MKNIFLLIILFSVQYNTLSGQEKIEQDWTSYYQQCDISPYIGQKFRVTGAIRKVSEDPNSKASIWVRIDDKNDGYTFFENNASKISITKEWQEFKIEGEVKESSSILNFGAYCKLNGEFYFDNFKVQVLNQMYIWQDIQIQNPSFEDTEDILFPSWNHGISPDIVKVKGYEVVYSDKIPYKGEKSLLIKGEGILSSEN